MVRGRDGSTRCAPPPTGQRQLTGPPPRDGIGADATLHEFVDARAAARPTPDVGGVLGLDHHRAVDRADRDHCRQHDRVAAAADADRLQPARGAVRSTGSPTICAARPAHEGRVLQRWVDGQPRRARCRPPVGARAAGDRRVRRRVRRHELRRLHLRPGAPHRPAVGGGAGHRTQPGAVRSDRRPDAAGRRRARRGDGAGSSRTGIVPIAVVVAAGTTNTGAIDPIRRAGEIAKKHGAWFHVDGAYGLPGILDERLTPLYDGLELADSAITDPHKWLNAPVGVAATFVRDRSILYRAFTQEPADYLEGAFSDDDVQVSLDSMGIPYFDFGVELSSPVRGVAVWGDAARAGGRRRPGPRRAGQRLRPPGRRREPASTHGSSCCSTRCCRSVSSATGREGELAEAADRRRQPRDPAPTGARDALRRELDGGAGAPSRCARASSTRGPRCPTSTPSSTPSSPSATPSEPGDRLLGAACPPPFGCGVTPRPLIEGLAAPMDAGRSRHEQQ